MIQHGMTDNVLHVPLRFSVIVKNRLLLHCILLTLRFVNYKVQVRI
jgi:hypothetical protein